MCPFSSEHGNLRLRGLAALPTGTAEMYCAPRVTLNSFRCIAGVFAMSPAACLCEAAFEASRAELCFCACSSSLSLLGRHLH